MPAITLALEIVYFICWILALPPNFACRAIRSWRRNNVRGAKIYTGMSMMTACMYVGLFYRYGQFLRDLV